MRYGSNLPPTDILLILGGVLGAGLLLLVLVPMVISLWRVRKAPLEEIQEVKEYRVESLGIVIGVVLVDIFLFVVFGLRMSKKLFLPALGLIDILFLLFAAYYFLLGRIGKARAREAQEGK